MLKRIHRDERGFTLVELLVTVAILALLFGVAAIALTGVRSGAETDVKASEVGIVESAIDIYMAVEDTDTITARTVCATITAGGSDFSKYLRTNTKYGYTWDTDGVVTQCTP